MWGLEKGEPTSLLPLPKPLTTGPDNRIGKGGEGPVDGPATGERARGGRWTIT